MGVLIGIMVFAALFAIYDALRKINHNILNQTEEIKRLQEDMKRNTKE